MSKRPNQSELKKLMSFALPEKTLLFWGTICLILGSSVILAFPQAVRITLDEALTTKNHEMIDRLGLVMIFILAIQAIASSLRYYLFTLAGERTVKRIRQKLFHSFMIQEIGYFDRQKTGDLMSRLNSDATVLQNALSVNISMILRNFASAVGGLIFLFVTSWQLTLLLLLVLPPAAFMAAKFGSAVRGISAKVQEALGGASAVADEALSNIRTVRTFAAEHQEEERFDKALNRALFIARTKIKAISRFMGGISLLGMSAIVGILWLGGRMVVDGSLSIGVLSAFILYTMTVAISVSTLGGLWTDFMNATGAARRIFAVLDREPLITSEKTESHIDIEGRVRMIDLEFCYPSRPDIKVFESFNLEINRGETVALVGKSGSGKSTIASLLLRLYDPQQGQVLIDDINIKGIDGSLLRKLIGTVSQEPVLMSTSIRENIAYGRPDATMKEIEEAADFAFATDFIKDFPEGFETLVGERGIQLSGGQKQRIAIARAMLKNPKILILDEATSALDAKSEELVQKALVKLMEGRTVLVIAHRLSTIRDADRIIVLNEGAIVEEGAHKDLIDDREGFYFKLVQKQISGAESLPQN